VELIRGRKVFRNLKDMFDAIRGQDGILRPAQWMGDESKLIQVSALLDNPETNTEQGQNKQGK